jgi:CRP-like cAMP-binding protein
LCHSKIAGAVLDETPWSNCYYPVLNSPDLMFKYSSSDRRRVLWGKRQKRRIQSRGFSRQGGTGKTISTYRKDKVIFGQGDIADTIFYVQKGKVKIVVLSDQGKEAVVGIIEAGQFFGEGCLNGHSVRIATATAMEECLITSITKAAMTAILDNEPKVFAHVCGVPIEPEQPGRRGPDRSVVQLQREAARAPSASACQFRQGGQPAAHRCEFRSGTLAEMIGTTRSRVSVFMNKFRKLGFISYNGNVEVHRSLLHAVLQERPQLERDE